MQGLRAGGVYVDMTTSDPSLAAEMHARGRVAASLLHRAAHAACTGQSKGFAVLDAPVSGGDVGARNAALSVMVGGDSGAFAQVLPLFEKMGARWWTQCAALSLARQEHPTRGRAWRGPAHQDGQPDPDCQRDDWRV